MDDLAGKQAGQTLQAMAEPSTEGVVPLKTRRRLPLRVWVASHFAFMLVAAAVVAGVLGLQPQVGHASPLDPPATPTPGLSIVWNYTGSFFTLGASGSHPMDIQIIQNGLTLGGATKEGESFSTNTGTINPDGTFQIVENWSGGGSSQLYGSFVGSDQIIGAWAYGTWDVTLVPTIAGNYTGSDSGSEGTFPMQLQMNQLGSVLNGTMTESGATLNETGTIMTDGTFQVTDGLIDWSGSLAGPGHLSGTWISFLGTSGTWDVTAS